MKIFRHFITITRHRHKVMLHCFKAGLIWRGLLHDLSKYLPSEFIPGARYYQGNRSPQAKERELFGYSAAWLHHKGRNKHHFEYWVDSGANNDFVFVKMPAVYFGEMVCDRIAASKIYLKESYTASSPLQYFNTRTHKQGMNRETCRDLEYFLTMLAEKGEDYMFEQLKKFIKENKKAEKQLNKKADK